MDHMATEAPILRAVDTDNETAPQVSDRLVDPDSGGDESAKGRKQRRHNRSRARQSRQSKVAPPEGQEDAQQANRSGSGRILHLMGTFLAIGLGAAALYIATVDTNLTRSDVNQIFLTATDTLKADFDARLLSQKDGLDSERAKLRSEVEAQFAETGQRLDDLGASATGVAQLSQTNSERIASFEPRLTAIDGRTSDAAGEVRLLSARIVKLENRPVLTAAAAASRPVIKKLPFKAVAMDRWGETLQLTVLAADAKAQSEVRFLNAGDVFDGFRVVRLDARDQMATIESPEGVQTTYEMRGGQFKPVQSRPTPVPYADGTVPLTVAASPANARVRIMNIGPKYRDGIPLVQGVYDIEVTAAGYLPYRNWHRVGENGRILEVALEPRVN